MKLVRSWVIAVLGLWVCVATPEALNDLILLKGHVAKHCKTKCVDAGELYEALKEASQRYGIESIEILALMRVESAFRPQAVNRGNKGLMQVLMRYHRPKFEGKNPHNVHANVMVGASILAQCKEKAASREKSWKCYNGGGDPSYVKKVRKAYQEARDLRIII